MTPLEQLIEKLNGDESVQARRAVVVLLRALNDNLTRAGAVWTEAREQASGDAQAFTFVLWFGAERAKTLHQLHLDQRRLGTELTAISGVPFSDSMGIIETIDVVEAYAQADEESGAARTASALETLATRSQRLEEVITELSAI